VVFPHVKESIELLQVRQLCRNINEFIESLHEIGVQQQAIQDIVDAETELIDKSLIPEQIGTFLKSPYISEVEEYFENSKHQLIEEQGEWYRTITQHVKSLVEKTCHSMVFEDGYIIGNEKQDKLEIKIKSSRRVGALILDATVKKITYQLSDNNLRELMQLKSTTNLCRVQAEEVSRGCYQLYDNCEMLVGDESITQESDIEHFIERFKADTQIKPKLPVNVKIIDYWERSCIGPLRINKIELDVVFEKVTIDNALAIKIVGKGDFVRTHNVCINEAGEHCVFTAMAVPAEILTTRFGENNDSKIIEYTWIRNRHIDVVDFYVDEMGNIMGRVVHPIKSLDWEEFVYCTYILGVEADRLEYIFSQEDVL